MDSTKTAPFSAIVGIPIPPDYFHRQPLWGNAGGYRAVVEIAQAVEAEGAVTRLMFPGQDNGAVNALILPGGGDIDPAHYGQARHPQLGELDPELDRFQLNWARKAMEAGIPVLGICRGMQVMNVAGGGSLLQHLEPAERHFPEWMRQDASLRPRPVHSVRIEPGSVMAKTVRHRRSEVNSLHHQAVDLLADGFRPTAWSQEDGLVEAMERTDCWHVGVQFHPEDLRHTDARFAGLFRDLIAHTSRSLEVA